MTRSRPTARSPGLSCGRWRWRRCAPGPGRLLWDVGAGSGSIGIEWMRADPLARAIAVEPRPDRAARAGRNAAALGVPGLT